MSFMPDKVFIDTNILIYSFLDNDEKRHEAAVQLLSSLLEKEVFISTQVMSEVYSALSKNRIQHEVIAKFLSELEENMNIASVNLGTVKKCLFLKKKYSYSYWDSLILASALEHGCAVVCSEDMQHGQEIEQSLVIMNPFAIGLR
jgi:predicted nucleic acid-binding protein